MIQDPEKLDVVDLIELVRTIQATLWPDGEPRAKWQGSYIQDIAAIMKDAGLAPEELRDVTYTTAPEDYDYTGFGTRDVGVVATTEKGVAVRKITTRPNHTGYQRGRYGSGLHMAADTKEFEKLVNYGFVILKEMP